MVSVKGVEVDNDELYEEGMEPNTGITQEEEELHQKIRSIIDDSFLGALLNGEGNEDVTDVSFNSTHCYIQDNKKGRDRAKIQPTKEQVYSLGRRIAQVQGKELTNAEPILDTEISGLRVNFMHPLISPFGTTMALRVSKPYMAIRDINTLANEKVATLLKLLIQADTNLVISGQTGSGKTELQKLLVGFIQDEKKISLLEDTMDSHIKMLYPDKDINSWRTMVNSSRKNQIDFRKLIKAALRNNPDWLMISEIRGDEAYDFIESALTGHSVLTTIHAHGAAAIPSRIRNMIGQTYNMNPILLGQDIVNNIRFGLHMEMVIEPEGIRRRIREIVEFTGYEETGVTSRVIYKVKKEYNDTTKRYDVGHVTGTLSEKTLDILQDKELYHLLPVEFREGQGKQADRKGA